MHSRCDCKAEHEVRVVCHCMLMCSAGKEILPSIAAILRAVHCIIVCWCAALAKKYYQVLQRYYVQYIVSLYVDVQRWQRNTTKYYSDTTCSTLCHCMLMCSAGKEILPSIAAILRAVHVRLWCWPAESTHSGQLHWHWYFHTLITS